MKAWAIILLLAPFMALAETDVQFFFADPQFGLSQTTNRLVVLQAESGVASGGQSTLLPFKLSGYTDTNGQLTFSNLYGSSLSGWYHIYVPAPPQRVDFDIWVQSTSLGLINGESIIGTFGANTYPPGAWAWSAQTSDQRYAAYGSVITNGGSPLLAGTNTYVAVVGGSNQVNVPFGIFDTNGAAAAVAVPNAVVSNSVNVQIISGPINPTNQNNVIAGFAGQAVGVPTFTPVVANYYVDNGTNNGSLGNDSNPGTNQLAPLRTIAALMAKPWTNGTIAAFAGGSRWHEQLTVPLNSNLVFFAYGNGLPPMLDASDPVPTNLWTKFGTTNAWTLAITSENPSDGEITFIWENGRNLMQTNSIAAVATNLGSIYFLTNSTTTNVFINPYAGGSPVTNGSLFEIANRLFGFYVPSGFGYQNGWGTVNGLWTRRNLGNNGSYESGRGWTNLNLLITDGSKHNGVFYAGNTLRNITASGAYFGDNELGEGGAGMIELFDDSSAYPASYYLSNVNCSLPSYDIYVGGFGNHNTSGTTPYWGTITLDNCSAINLGTSTGLSGVTNAIYNGFYGVNYQTGDGDHVNTVLNGCTFIGGDHNGAGCVVPQGAGSLLVSNCYLSSPITYTSGGSLDLINLGSYAENLVIVKSTLVSPLSSTVYGVAFGNSACTFYNVGNEWNFKNNFFYSATTMASFISDNNNYDGGGTWTYNNVNYTTLAQLQAATGSEMTGLYTPKTGTNNSFTGVFSGNISASSNNNAAVSFSGPLITTNPMTGQLVPTYNGGGLTNISGAINTIVTNVTSGTVTIPVNFSNALSSFAGNIAATTNMTPTAGLGTWSPVPSNGVPGIIAGSPVAVAAAQNAGNPAGVSNYWDNGNGENVTTNQGTTKKLTINTNNFDILTTGGLYIAGIFTNNNGTEYLGANGEAGQFYTYDSSTANYDLINFSATNLNLPKGIIMGNGGIIYGGGAGLTNILTAVLPTNITAGTFVLTTNGSGQVYCWFGTNGIAGAGGGTPNAALTNQVNQFSSSNLFQKTILADSLIVSNNARFEANVNLDNNANLNTFGSLQAAAFQTAGGATLINYNNSHLLIWDIWGSGGVAIIINTNINCYQPLTIHPPSGTASDFFQIWNTNSSTPGLILSVNTNATMRYYGPVSIGSPAGNSTNAFQITGTNLTSLAFAFDSNNVVCIATNLIKPIVQTGMQSIWSSNGWLYNVTSQHPNGVLIAAP